MTDSFVHRQNIERFRRLLKETSDAGSRETIQKLLEEELAKDEAPPDDEEHRPSEGDAG